MSEVERGQHPDETQSTLAPFEIAPYALLKLQAEFLTDVERVRIANVNRLRALREDFGLISGPEVTTCEQVSEMFAAVERKAESSLRRALKAIPFYSWVMQITGLGDKQMGRLLGTIGHPLWRFDGEAQEWRQRTVGQLWSYCGYAVHDGRAPARRRGEQTAYNSDARMRAFLIAESCIKQVGGAGPGETRDPRPTRPRSPFRDVYDAGREKYADALHIQPCARCGPKGHPAQEGSQLSDGHKHMRAMRLVAKSLLKEMWLAARDCEEGSGELALAA